MVQKMPCTPSDEHEHRRHALTSGGRLEHNASRGDVTAQFEREPCRDAITCTGKHLSEGSSSLRVGRAPRQQRVDWQQQPSTKTTR